MNLPTNVPDLIRPHLDTFHGSPVIQRVMNTAG